MIKKWLLALLIIVSVAFSVGCSLSEIRSDSCTCDCDYCDCNGEDDRNDDPGEYEGWRD